LTVKLVDALKVPGYYSDGCNLYLRVSNSLNKSWVFIYKKDGKRTELGLGGYPARSLADARWEADGHNRQILEGLDPLYEKRRHEQMRRVQRAKLMTFADCAKAFIEAQRPGWKNPKHVLQWQTTLAQYVNPIIGQIDVSAIDTQLVLKCLNPIWLTKNETAGRLRGRIESILDWATVHKHRKGDNPARWRGHLDKLLAKPGKIQKPKHHNAMPYRDVGLFVADLREQDSVSASCLIFTIMTSARTGEAIGATWDEVDLSERTWTVPANRMKSGRSHRVPLNQSAMSIINQMWMMRHNDFIFSVGKTGLSNMAMLTLLKRMDRTDITVHGFRSSFRDWAAETTDYSNETVEMALAHTIKNQAEAAYRRGDLYDKRTQLMRDWGDYLARVLIK